MARLILAAIRVRARPRNPLSGRRTAAAKFSSAEEIEQRHLGPPGCDQRTPELVGTEHMAESGNRSKGAHPRGQPGMYERPHDAHARGVGERDPRRLDQVRVLICTSVCVTMICTCGDDEAEAHASGEAIRVHAPSRQELSVRPPDVTSDCRTGATESCCGQGGSEQPSRR